MKLTNEQIAELQNAFLLAMFPSTGVERLIAVYHEMIAASDTHRIVEAPEGFEFDGPQYESLHVPKHDMYMGYFHTRPIPAPCPPPKLEPVTVTLEDIYSFTPEAPAEFEAVFGQVKPLVAKGFTHYIGNRGGRVSPIAGLDDSVHRICLRKWEGK